MVDVTGVDELQKKLDERLTTDFSGKTIDLTVAKGDYKNRKQRDEAEEKVKQDAYDNAPYTEKRRRSYPPIGDQLDALWKGGDDAEAMKAIVNKVKSDNPKG